MNYTKQALFDIYQALYGDNMEGAEEDYAQEFEKNYSPANLSADITLECMMSALRGLVGELRESYEDAADVAAVAIDAGADPSLLDELGL